MNLRRNYETRKRQIPRPLEPLNGEREEKVYPPVEEGKLRLIPLGGLGEIGKNMMVIEYGDDILVVDSGIMFPKQEMLGVDFVIPNTKYLEDNKHRIQAIIITHGHEDHIGAIPYILSRIGDPPLYATKLTKGLIETKMKEFNTKRPNISIIKPGDKIKLGPFEVEPFRVNHSIPDGVGFAIHTPLGLLVHSGDFKFDHTPVDKEVTDFGKLAGYAQEGVLVLFSDSTNVEIPGYTMSEKTVGETVDRIFERAKGRVIISSFASLINRVQQSIDSAVKYRRRVMISGRSMENNVETSTRLGYLRIPQGVLVDSKEAKNIRDEELVVICTGSQGEAYSALVRMASGDHREVVIKPGDTIVVSASPIPGNETAISATINNLFRLGADVIYGRQVDIHVSGHAAQEELKTMLDIVKPKYFIPVHGEDRHLILHCRLAQEIGLSPSNTLALENGIVVEFDKEGNYQILKERVPAGYVLIDGLGVGDVGNIVLRDRQAMSRDGIFVIICTVDNKTGKLITSPDLISRGFIYMRAHEELVHKTRAEVRRLMSKYNNTHRADYNEIKMRLRDDIGQYLYRHTQRRPMVIPVIIEV
ncbi:ribonuclease J [Patescibacteria group bacterium]|nr:ribonuclease J [Patescibacteria group bacterium]